MNNDEWQDADRWLQGALELPAVERKRLLQECPDQELQARVLELIELAERSDRTAGPGSERSPRRWRCSR